MAEIVDGRGVRWVPVAVARRLLGVTRQRVHQLVDSGALAASRFEGTLLVSMRSIEDRLGRLPFDADEE